MPKRLGFAAYSIMVLVGYALSGAIALSTKGVWVGDCRRPPAPGLFISSCSSAKFGDYEHDAFWFNLETEAVVNLKAADVVFTGSSRTMFAFSTEEVRGYFAARGLTQFNLGFGFDEQQAFFAALATRFNLHPRVLVIGIDPYFVDHVSGPAAAAMGDWFERGHGIAKKIQIELQSTFCRWKLMGCAGVASAAFRSTSDGYFVWRDILKPDRESPRTQEPHIRDVQVNVPLAVIAAKEFLDRIGMPAACVVLVPMPTPLIWLKPDPVKQVADALGSMYVDADTGEDLAFVDQTHLSFYSAKRFSAEFLRRFDQLPQDCLQQKR